MALIELTTNLKSLTNKQTGAKSLLVSKDINDPPKTGGIAVQANARIDDLARHTKLLTRKPGLKFLGNQALLAQTDMKKFIANQKGKKFKAIAKNVAKKALDTLENTALATASILAQVPVNGTGTHFVRGFKNVRGTYLGEHGMKISSFNAPDGSIIPNIDPNEKSEGQFFVSPENKTTQLGNISKNKYNQGDPTSPAAGLPVSLPGGGKDYLESDQNARERAERAKKGETIIANNDGTAGNDDKSKLKDKKNADDSTIKAKFSADGKPSEKTFKQRPDGIPSGSVYIQQYGDNLVANGEKAFVDNTGDAGWTGPISASKLEEKQSTTEITVNRVGQAAENYKQRPDEIEDEATYLQAKTSNQVAGGEKAFVDNIGDQGWSGPLSGSILKDRETIGEIVVNKVGKAARTFKQRPGEVSDDNTYLKGKQSVTAAAGNRIESLYNSGVVPGVDPVSGSSIHVDPKYDQGLNTTSFVVNDGVNEREFRQRPDVGHTDSSTQAIQDINIDGVDMPYLDNISIQGNKSEDVTSEDRIKRSAIAPGAKPDPVQSLAKQTSSILGSDQEDIIPFEFNTFYPGNTTGNFLYFRAFLGSFSDNFTGDWAGTKYVGRAEEFFTYQGFKRDISFDFQLAAFSKDDLEPLYEKINLLVGSTAPTYGNGSFMKGTLTKVTIGDYLKEVPGFIGSVGLSWDVGSPWEIAEEGKRLPHILNCNISFTPIHEFVPTAESKFIG